MNELQRQTDVEQAKKALDQIDEARKGKVDPRTPALVQRTPADGRVPDIQREIKVGKVPPNRKTFWQKLKETIAPDRRADESFWDWLFFRVVVPKTLNLGGEIAHSAIDAALGRDPKNRPAGNTHVSNARLYRERSYGGGNSGYARKGILDDYDWDEQTAKDYFQEIIDVAEKYRDVSVTNVYSICGLGHLIRTTDKNWGWTPGMLSRADVVPVDAAEERWTILLPEARSLL